jgi:heme-degrading monooxygenase HmoA
MTTELIRYKIPAGQAAAFEEAYRKTEHILQNSSHCLGYRLLQGVEETENRILLLYWDSVEGHEQGFRQEPAFGQFFALVKPFFSQIQEMKHYHETAMSWTRAA